VAQLSVSKGAVLPAAPSPLELGRKLPLYACFFSMYRHPSAH
jgi:hypothetical protein